VGDAADVTRGESRLSTNQRARMSHAFVAWFVDGRASPIQFPTQLGISHAARPRLNRLWPRWPSSKENIWKKV
jgi:hypothetical protein